ncbi:hypothetical protein [Sphingomonas sp. ID0503]|uniref:hypothetical protein n=1 Tax=Sphingomonas sp. ID0503 TaxID=3399691 RepID=UPI003AFAE233
MIRSVARQQTGALALLLVVLALGMRVLIPAGWMPSADRIGIELCTSAGPVTVKMAGHAMHHGKHKPAERMDHPCAFAGAGAVMVAPFEPVDAVVAAFVAVRLFMLPSAVAIGRGLAAPPPPPTGPPSTF